MQALYIDLRRELGICPHVSPCIPARKLLLICYTVAVSATILRQVYESSLWTSKQIYETSHNRAESVVSTTLPASHGVYSVYRV